MFHVQRDFLLILASRGLFLTGTPSFVIRIGPPSVLPPSCSIRLVFLLFPSWLYPFISLLTLSGNSVLLLKMPVSQPHIKKQMQVDSCNGEVIQEAEKEAEDASQHSYHGEDGQLARLFDWYITPLFGRVKCILGRYAKKKHIFIFHRKRCLHIIICMIRGAILMATL